MTAAAVGVKKYLLPRALDWYSRTLLAGGPSSSSSSQTEMLAALEALQQTQQELLAAVHTLNQRLSQQQQQAVGFGGAPSVTSSGPHASSVRGWQPEEALGSSLLTHDGYTASAATIRAGGAGGGCSTASYHGAMPGGALVTGEGTCQGGG